MEAKILSSIQFDDLPSSRYLPQDRCDRFVLYDNPTKLAGEVGYEEKGTGKHQSNSLFSPNYPSRTLCAGDYKAPLLVMFPPKEGAGTIEWQGQKYSVRRLTEREYWQIQSCDLNDFEKINGAVTKTWIYTLVGNSIAVNVLRDIFSKYLHDYVGTNKKLRLFESFSGMGTQAMALKKANIDFENVCTSEIEPNAIIAYAMIHCGMEKNDARIDSIDLEVAKDFILNHNICYNFKTEQVEMPKNPKKIKQIYLACQLSKNLGDISGINTKDVPQMDLFTFSSPCTDISRAGLQQGFEERSNTRSSLLWECEKILRDKKPKFIMMENVKDIVSPKFKADFDRWLEILKGYGYECHWNIENAIDHDVPQLRERMILIGMRQE